MSPHGGSRRLAMAGPAGARLVWSRHQASERSGDRRRPGGRGSAYGTAPATLDGRIRALGHAAVAGLPASKRYHRAASFDGPALDRLVGAMRAWVDGLGLDHAGFAARFFDRHPSSPVGRHLRRSAEVVARATTSAEMREATDALAAGMLAVGLDQWSRFLMDAHDRAMATANTAPVVQPIRSTLSRGRPVPINPFGILVPGTPENEAWVHGAGRAFGAARDAVGQVFNSQIREETDNVGQSDATSGAPVPPATADAPEWIPPEVRALVPPEWGDGEPTKKGEGRRWTDPENKGNGVRIDRGNPDNSQPTQQQDHVVVNSGGKVIGRDGRPLPPPGRVKDHPEQAHIPLPEYQGWRTWNKP